jgi:hypothetical protein
VIFTLTAAGVSMNRAEAGMSSPTITPQATSTWHGFMIRREDRVPVPSRTHLQDATPLTVGQELSGYVREVSSGSPLFPMNTLLVFAVNTPLVSCNAKSRPGNAG